MRVIQNYVLTLNFVKEKNYKQLKNTLICKAMQFMLTINILKKTLHNPEDGASSVQVGVLNT